MTWSIILSYPVSPLVNSSFTFFPIFPAVLGFSLSPVSIIFLLLFLLSFSFECFPHSSAQMVNQESPLCMSVQQFVWVFSPHQVCFCLLCMILLAQRSSSIVSVKHQDYFKSCLFLLLKTVTK